MRTRWLVAGLALSLAGCGGGAAGTASPGAAPVTPAVIGQIGVSVPVPSPTPTTSAGGSTATILSTTANQSAAPLAPSISGSYGDTFTSMSYVMYVSTKAKQPFPLVVALHGCHQTPADFEAATRWFEDAEANGYAVVMPAHSATANDPDGCWLYQTEHYRGRGEAATLAGLVHSVQLLDGADARRTYVVGLDSGGAQAIALAATYPDVFAAVGAVAGSEYQPCRGDELAPCAVQDAVASGKAAYAQDDAWRRAVPALLMHGDADTTVAPAHLAAALTSLATMDDGFTSAGAFPAAFDAAPVSRQSGGGGGGYRYDEYTAARGALDWVVVHGMAHEWPTAPSATAWFRSHLLAHAQ